MGNSNEMKFYIFHTLGELMKHMDYENISTKYLCEASHISRQTFYRHFYDKHAVLNWHFDLIADDSLKQVGRTLTWQQAHFYLFDNLYKERVVHVQANKSEGYNYTKNYNYRSSLEMYIETLKKYKRILPNDSTLFQIDAAALLCTELTAKWCRGGMNESPKSLASLIDCVLPHEVKTILEQGIA